MAKFDYGRMRRTATRLLDRFNQGEVQLKRVAEGPPPNDWTPGKETETRYELSATVKRLHQRYENGVLIVETGDMVTFAVPEVTPMLGETLEDGTHITDTLIIDGAEHAITNLTKVPAAGTTVLWKAWCAA